MRRKIAVLSVLLVLALNVVPLLTVSAQDEIEAVCLVTDVGKVNDGGFNQSAYEGMEMAAEELDLESTFIETQAPTDYEANIATCLQEGPDLIVTVGFAMQEATTAAAAENPDVYFIGVDQGNADPETLPNLVNTRFREDQAGFLVGALAALMSESGTIGGVYGIEIPPVVKFRHGFEQGARYINPDIILLGSYIPSFTDIAGGAALAEQMIGEGADVIFGAGGPTGQGGITYATQNGAMGIGVDLDEYNTTFGGGETPGAENLISSATKRVDVSVHDAIAALVNGDDLPAGNVYVFEAANNGVAAAPPHDSDVPEEVTAQIDEIFEMLASGELETGVDPASGALLSEEATPEATMEATAAS